MATRRGIFFNSKARSVESNVLLEGKTRSPPKIESPAVSANEDPSSGSSSNSQTSPPKSATAANLPTGVVKKKLILKNSKRSLTKTIYSGPRKIFSTNYKVISLFYRVCRRSKTSAVQANRSQLNHKAFFGGEPDEFDPDGNDPGNLCPTRADLSQTTKGSAVVKSKSTDPLRATTTTVMENGKTKLVCPRDQKKVPSICSSLDSDTKRFLSVQMYTIVPNIRQPTTCEELGETQSYIDGHGISSRWFST